MVTFEVLAIEKGTPALTGTTTITVNIIDVNDVVPTFQQDFYNLDVPCDEPVGSTIETVSATDTDSGKLGHKISITYFYNILHISKVFLFQFPKYVFLLTIYMLF